MTVESFEWGQSETNKKTRLYNTLKAKHRHYYQWKLHKEEFLEIEVLLSVECQVIKSDILQA